MILKQVQGCRKEISGIPIGRMLVVDLTNSEWHSMAIDSETAAGFLGGRGVSAYLLARRCGFENRHAEPALFSPGLLTGAIPFGQTALTTFSGSKSMGVLSLQGLWGGELKMAGFDHIMITGRSDTPVAVKITNGHIAIDDAAEIWDQDCRATGEQIRSLEGDQNLQTMVLAGPGGTGSGSMETLNDLFTVKKLKAISVRGTGGLKIFDIPGYKKAIREALLLFAGKHELNNCVIKPGREQVDITFSAGRQIAGDPPFSGEELQIILDCLGFARAPDIESMISLIYSITGRRYSAEDLAGAVQRIMLAETGGTWE